MREVSRRLLDDIWQVIGHGARLWFANQVDGGGGGTVWGKGIDCSINKDKNIANHIDNNSQCKFLYIKNQLHVNPI